MCCQAMRKRRVRRMANGEWRMGVGDGARPDYVLSRSGSLAACNGFGGRLLSGHEILSQIRTLRSDVTNQTICQFNPGKHCGGTREREHRIVCSVLQNSAGVAERIGNAFDPLKPCTASQRRSGQKTHCRLRVCRTHVAGPHSLVANTSITPFAIRHSPFAAPLSRHV
jgi:hypothetical protein